jgi:signal transduction histidine kinase/DNA-binding response OmpR family regulator
MENILVVDDEAGILQLCKRVLETKTRQVVTMFNGEQAIAALAHEPFDLVITDLKMPGIDGVDLLRHIKTACPSTSLIVITGQATIASAIEALKNGAYDYLLKPFSISELRSAVEKCMEHTRLRRQENVLLETLYLYELSREMVQTHTEEQLLEFILERAVKAVNADNGSILLFSAKDETLHLIAGSTTGHDQNKSVLKLGEGVAGWVAKNNESLLIQDGFAKLPQFKDLPVRQEIASSMVVPLLHDKTILGVLCLNRLVQQIGHPFTSHDLESLKIFTLHAGMLLVSLKHQQALEELNRLKSEFVSNVSHEVRTPLMAISGATELLSARDNPLLKDEKVKMLLELISRNARRMHCLVNDLLDFSRLETGQLKMQYALFNLKEVIRETLQDLGLQAKEKDLAFSEELPADEREVFGDREKIKQVVTNLVANAVKFTPAGGSVRAGYAFEADGGILLQVADSGIGIAKEQQERIFDKFYQVDGSSIREKAGFGLGLAIVKSIIENHRGKIWVESEPGKGSRFFVRLPPQDAHGA